MSYRIEFDSTQGVLLVTFSGILTQKLLVQHYLDVTELMARRRMQCSIVDLLQVNSSPVSSQAIVSLSRSEPLFLSAKPRAFIASGRESVSLWRNFISHNRNPARTRLAHSMTEALELLGLDGLRLEHFCSSAEELEIPRIPSTSEPQSTEEQS